MSWGERPLTFLTAQHLARARELPAGFIVVEPCACGGWVTFRAVEPSSRLLRGALVALDHDEAVAFELDAARAIANMRAAYLAPDAR